MTHLRIVCDKPQGRFTQVFINGEKATNVTGLIITASVNDVVRVEMECLFPEVLVDGEFRREIHTFTAEPDGAS